MGFLTEVDSWTRDVVVLTCIHVLVAYVVMSLRVKDKMPCRRRKRSEVVRFVVCELFPPVDLEGAH